MSRKVLVLCAGLMGALGVLMVPGTAVRAQELAPDEEEARSLFEAGERAYGAGRYEAALSRFAEAYELSHRPALLYNMANAAERLRRDEEALRYYEQYNQASPNSPQRARVLERIEFLRAAIASGGRPPEPATRGSGESPSGSTSIAEEWWFWTLIAAVLVGGGVGIGVGVALSGTEPPIPGTQGVIVMALELP